MLALLFPEPFSTQFALSGLAVIAGVAVHSYSRRVAKAAAEAGGAPAKKAE